MPIGSIVCHRSLGGPTVELSGRSERRAFSEARTEVRWSELLGPTRCGAEFSDMMFLLQFMQSELTERQEADEEVNRSILPDEDT